MKQGLKLFLLLLSITGLSIMILSVSVVSATEEEPLAGKTIALDAGHGDGDPGAIGYCTTISVAEADVNLRTREVLQQKLKAAGATVFLVPQPVSRRDRVEAAEAAGSDILLSIHHNGSANISSNYTKTFVTHKNDKKLASFVHPELLDALGLRNAGIKNDGFGMTVYGSLPGILTEAYFITNTDEACDFLGAQSRIQIEAQAHYDGIVAYFADDSSGGGNGNGKGKGPKK